MSGLLILILVLVFVLIPVGSVVTWYYVRDKAIVSMSVGVFATAILLFIIGLLVATYGFIHLLWAIPVILALGGLSLLFQKSYFQIPLEKNKELLLELVEKGELKDSEIIKTSNAKNSLAFITELIITASNKQKRILESLLKISNNNFELDLEYLGKQHAFTEALNNMKGKLSAALEKENKRKIEEERRNWAVNGVAKFNDILHMQNADLQTISYKFISGLVDYVGATQGALFVVENIDKEIEDDLRYEMKGAVAYNREKNINISFKNGEGLIGRCAFERLPIYMKEVPGNYVTVTSGLGDSNPRSILIVPAIYSEKVYGVIELASIHELNDYKRDFVMSLGEIVASSLSAIKINEQTRILLENSKQQGEELAAQEEEMRQNLEELQATQEEVSRLRTEEQRKIRKLENRINELEAQLGINN